MYLKSLEIQGFKSFPDKTKLEFGRGMTAVVGPNGSGKSNIADAVRWVLGEQSAKSLRSSRMEDVIFSGTAQRRAVGYAQVTLGLDNTDRELDFDSNEVMVSRRYYRSGESEYLINGEQVRLRDIHELFMDTGLGSDGYSMVSQGRVEEMVSQRSDQRREIFEEAVGIHGFRVKRDEATRRLDQAEENLVRLRDIMSELESRIGPLKEQSEKAVRYLALAEERKNIEIALWLRTLAQSDNSVREQAGKTETVRIQYENAEEKLKEICEQEEKAREDANAVTVSIESVTRERSDAQTRAAELDAQAKIDLAEISAGDEEIKRLLAELDDIRISREKLESDILTANEDFEAFKKKSEDLSKQAEESIASSGSLLEEIAACNNERAAALSGIDAIRSDLALASSDENAARSARDEILARIETIDRNRAGRKQADEIRESLDSRQADLDAAQAESAKLKNDRDACDIKLKSRAERARKTKADCEALRLELDRTNSRLAMLEETERNMEGYSGAVKAVMNAGKRGNLRGLRGVLSQLISVQSEYAVAIETALGAAVQNIVTDTENDAKRAMYYLRDGNFGRATFLPISAMKGRDLEEDGLEDCYGYIGIASDIVSCDDDYRDIISYLLGRTVIAEDTDCALAISKKYRNSFKVVTLDGQVINPGGSMTGGSQAKGFGFIGRGAEIDALKSKVSKLEEKYKQAQSADKTAQTEAERAGRELGGCDTLIFRSRDKVMKLTNEVSLLSQRLADVEAADKQLEAEKELAVKRSEEFRQLQESASAKAHEISEKLDAAQTAAQQIEDKLSLLNKRKDDAAEITNTLRMAALDAMRDAREASARADTADARRAEYDARTADINNRIETVRENARKLGEAAEGTKKIADGIRKEAEGFSAKIAELVSEREKFEALSTSLAATERSLRDEKEKLSSELVRLDEKQNQLQTKRDDIIRRLFEEYSLTRAEAEALEINIEGVTAAEKRLSRIKSEIRSLGSVNVGAPEEYKEVSERYEFLSSQIEDSERSKSELLSMISDLTTRMASIFKERFALINESFGKTFTDLFGGGYAELCLEDENDVLESDILIRAQPPGKKVKSLSLLSGGEKGLTSIALLFSILRVNPCSFCIFDEVEAALDDINVTKFAKYVRRMSGSTQFILITHRRGTMEEADVLYGVTMQENGVSKLLMLPASELARQLKLN